MEFGVFKNLVVRSPALVVSFSTMGKLEETGTGTGMEYYAEILRDLCKTEIHAGIDAETTERHDCSGTSK